MNRMTRERYKDIKTFISLVSEVVFIHPFISENMRTCKVFCHEELHEIRYQQNEIIENFVFRYAM